MKKKVVIIDYSTRFCRDLHHALTQTRAECWVCPPEEGTTGRKIRDGSPPSFLKIFSERGPIDSIIFDIINQGPDINDFDNYEEFVNAIEKTLRGFFKRLNLVIQQILVSSGASVWVLMRDDSFAYHLPVSINPIISQAQMSLVKCVAKEVAHFGIGINAVMLQFSAEDLNATVWKEAKGLKAYSSHFKPLTSESMAEYLATLIDSKNLPINGTTLHVGLGGTEYNI